MTARTRRTQRAPWLPALAAGVLVLLAGTTALAVEGAAQVRGTVTDVDGNPIQGVAVEMSPIGQAARPFTEKTRKDGSFMFPFLPFAKENYTGAFVKEGWLVRNIHIVSRQRQTTADRSEGMIIQDDSGVIGLDQNLPPIVVKPGGFVRIEVKMVPSDFFQKLAAEHAAAQAAAAGVESAPAAAAPAVREDPVMEARRLTGAGRFDEAVAVLDTAIQDEPTAERWLELGRVKERAADPAGAKAALARASGLDPEIRGARFLLGKIYSEEGRIDQAIAAVEQERELAPDDENTLRALAALYAGAGRTGEAIAIYEKMAAGPGVAPEILTRLASLYAEKGDFARAEEMYRRVVEADPGKADATYFKIGLSILNQRDLGSEERRRAADAFRRALKANPSHAAAHLELAYVLLGLGELEEAKAHMKQFLDLAPGDPKAAEVRAQLKQLG